MPVRLRPDLVHFHAAPWWKRTAAATIGAAVVASLLGGWAAAQDGTSGAPPLEETGCLLAPASPMEAILTAAGMPAQASPVAGATPIATPVTAASPVATDGAFDESLLLEDLTAAATSLTSCLTEGRFDEVAERTSPLFRGQLIGVPAPLAADLFSSLAATFPEMRYSIVEIGSPTLVDPNGTATAQIVWRVGHQVRVDEWTFVRGEVQGVPVWIVERAAPGSIDPQIDADGIEVTIADNRYQLESGTVSGDAVRFDVTNTDSVMHELLVLKLDEGVETSQLLTTPGPSLPAGFAFIGQATIPANASGQLVLMDLEPGRYAIVNLLPDESGLPRLAEGMEAMFEVE